MVDQLLKVLGAGEKVLYGQLLLKQALLSQTVMSLLFSGL